MVQTGLKPGEKIVVAGLQKAKPGDVVAPHDVSYQPNSAEFAALGRAG